VLHGDCLELLAELSPCSVDAVVCDPPYGINFQGKRWDGQAIHESAATTTRHRRLTTNEAFQEWARSWATECLRIKPGGHLLAFGSPRTFHRLASGLEDTGFELRDTLMWMYANGLPKSRRLPGGKGTALRPAWEPVLLARKSPKTTIERNMRRHRVGALNIDACRVKERWPANVLLDHSKDCTPEACTADCAVAAIDQADSRTRDTTGRRTPPSRLFFSSKVSRAERDAGCEHLPACELDVYPGRPHNSPPGAAHNLHPTVKPIALMRWLVRLVSPPGGLVLDPFCGSGSTGAAAVLEDRRFLGIERENAYVQIAHARIAHHVPTSGHRRMEAISRPLAPRARRG
jgi:site-specific DNA-methyltransferase (adenine-specific)